MPQLNPVTMMGEDASGVKRIVRLNTSGQMITSDLDTPQGTRTHTSAAPTTSATSLLAANTSRIVAVLQNAGTIDVFIGASGVTTSNGLLLQANGARYVDDESSDEWFGITASGTGDIRVMEVA